VVIDRRTLLHRGSLAALSMVASPRLAFARAESDQRFIFIIQRGAADGLGIVAPTGDPAFVSQRGSLAEEFASAPKLGDMFSLHPALANTLELYRQGEALFAHAIASPYRDRSHFDGQNILETGGGRAYQLKDGWMNRMLDLVPSGKARAVAVSTTIPTALRGSHDVASYAPSALPDASDDLLQRVAMLYEGDSQLHSLWSEALATREVTGDLTAKGGRNAGALGALVAKLLLPANGARIAMVETGGWDTHTQQSQRLNVGLRGLDAMIGALRTGLGAVWERTTVLVATEFGRTVAVNGTGGTDHGTATSALLLGGSVIGGRVLADWPGLAPAQLHEGRDLRPTMELDAFIASAVAGSFGTDPARAASVLFPTGKGGSRIEGLVRA
jgi:uncharacterized protein (DUF1501 family)